MLDYSLNIVGSEWIIIIFVALVLILGTGKLPGAAKKLGKAVNEYNKAKNGIETQMKDFSSENLEVNGPVETERQKMEMIVKTFGIDPVNKTDEELRKIITDKMGKSNTESTKN